MANRRGAAPTAPSKFDETAPVRIDLPSMPEDKGSDYKALASSLSSLSGDLLAMANRAQRRMEAGRAEAERAAAKAAAEQEQAALKAAPNQALADVQAADGSGGAPAPASSSPLPNDGRRVAAPTGALGAGIAATAKSLGIDPVDLATAISYETGGTFDPKKRGPRTKWGQHRGLIQWGEPQARQYGVDWENPIASQLGANGAIARYLRDAGVKPGMGLLDVYSAINAGKVGRYNASDTAAGGAPGTVRDKVERQMGGHRRKAMDLLSGVTADTGKPLALRRDGTPAADAYNRSLLEAKLYRENLGIAEDVNAAIEQAGGDPDKIEGFLTEAADKRFAAQPGLAGDPGYVEAIQRSYATRGAAAIAKARADREKAADAERQAAFEGGYTALSGDLERDAYTLGGNPQGDALLGQRLAGAAAHVDAAVEAGLITPLDGEKRKRAMAEDATVARVRGTFAALPDAVAKERFAGELEARWASGDGLFAGLSADKAHSLVGELASAAKREVSDASLVTKQQKAELDQLLADDVASVKATGAGVKFAGRDLSAEDIVSTLGPEKAVKWLADRKEAGALHQATADLPRLTEDEIAARLAELTPQAGAPGFEAAEKLYNAAEKAAAEILKERRDDPASSVATGFPFVAEAEQAVAEGAPDALAGLAAARWKAQGLLGIDEAARAVLTNAEAKALTASVRRAPPGEEYQALESLITGLGERYGDFADEAAVEVLRQTGVDAEMARYGAGIVKKLGLGQTPTTVELTGARVAGETAAAARATGPKAPDIRQTPPWRAIQRLQADPSLAADFDAKYGPNMSMLYLTQRLRPNDNTVIAPNGTESWQP